jgi:hypothetical protein
MLLGVSGSLTAAQQARTLSVSKEKGAPGETVYVTLTLVPALGDEARSVRMDVRFPKEALAFEGATAGDSLELAGGSLQIDVKDDPKDPDVTVLHLTGTADRPIAAGPVSYLTFKVPTTVTPPQMINFKTSADMSAQKTAGALQPLRILEGSVEVTTQPRVFACFFYMH